MRTIEQIAVEMLKCALSWEQGVMLIGNVSAGEVARIAISCVTSCPACGSEPWVNIDCDLCLICSALEGENL